MKLENRLGTNNIGNRITKEESAMIAKIESALVTGAVNHCENNNYQLILIPHLTKATGACENFSTLFSTDLFGQTAYLNQTGQLMLEAFMDSFKKTYCYGPSFRKEQHADSRHLIEFPLFEIEVADQDLKDLQKEINGIFGAMINKVEEHCKSELSILLDNPSLDNLKPPYESITYRDALKILREFNVSFGDDLKSDHEAYLVKWNDGKPLYVTHFPQHIKFFNMRLNRSDPTIVNSMDLLMPYSGESVGAAEREEKYTILKQRLENSDMLRLLEEAIKTEHINNAKDRPGYHWAMVHNEEAIHKEALERFDWYMNIIKENPIRHAGCGIGINRVTQAILQTNDIRYATCFPMNRETLF